MALLFGYETEETRFHLTVSDLYMRSPGNLTYVLTTNLLDNRQIVIDRRDVEIDQKVWDDLKEGDLLVYIRRLSYFGIFGRTFNLSRHDILDKYSNPVR